LCHTYIPSEKPFFPIIYYEDESKNVDNLGVVGVVKVFRWYRGDADVGSSTNLETQKKEIQVKIVTNHIAGFMRQAFGRNRRCSVSVLRLVVPLAAFA